MYLEMELFNLKGFPSLNFGMELSMPLYAPGKGDLGKAY